MLCADATNVGTMTSAFHTFALHLLCSTHHSHIGLARFPQQNRGVKQYVQREAQDEFRGAGRVVIINSLIQI